MTKPDEPVVTKRHTITESVKGVLPVDLGNRVAVEDLEAFLADVKSAGATTVVIVQDRLKMVVGVEFEKEAPKV